MEGLAHLVAESLVRHGFEPAFDHRRLQWSSWFRCQDGFSLVLAPCKPGLFALAEEVIAPGELAVGEGKRMLALFQIAEAEDLGMALGRLFLSGSPERERFASGRCFARYVVIEDPTQRQLALTALQRWMTSSAEAVTGVPQSISGDTHVPDETHVAPDAPVRGVERSSATSTSAPGSQNSRYLSGPDTESAPGQDTELVSGQDTELVSGQDTESVSRPDTRSVSRPDTGSVSRPDTEPVSGQDTKLVSGRDTESVSRPDTEPVSRPDTELVSGQDNESVSRPDTGSVSRPDTGSVSGQDNELVSGRDNELVSGRDNESVSGPDTEPVSGQDNELVSGQDNESVSRPDTGSVSRPDTELVSGQDNESVSRPDTGSVSGHDFSRAATTAISTAALAAAADALPYSESSNRQDQIGPPSPIPSGF